MSVRLELPGIYVDALALGDVAADLLVYNRDPEPDETGIPVESRIRFDLGIFNGASLDDSTLRVFLTRDGTETLVYDGSAFQAGFTGIVSSPSATVRRVDFATVADLDPIEEVTVRVQAETAGGFALDQSWTFTTEDTVPPALETVVARDKTTIRIRYDEPVLMGDGTAAGSALNPANYALAPQETPAVTLEVIEAVQVTTAEVDLSTDIEMTPGALYRLTADGVEDLKGNALVDATVDFTGFQPRVPEERRFELIQMLPQRRREDADLRPFVGILQEVLDLLLCFVDGWTDILDPDRAPEAFLDAMLQDLGNPFELDLSAEDKRRLLRVLVDAYRQKGTATGIVNVIRFFLSLEVTITEFHADEAWEIGVDELGETTVLGPSALASIYSFNVVAPRSLTAEEKTRIREIADSMKPAHTHLIDIEEPTTPETFDHLELGVSELGDTWILH